MDKRIPSMQGQTIGYPYHMVRLEIRNVIRVSFIHSIFQLKVTFGKTNNDLLFQYSIPNQERKMGYRLVFPISDFVFK